LGKSANACFQPPGALGFGHQPAAQLQVFGHRHLWKQLAPFGHQGHAALDNLVSSASGSTSPSSSTSPWRGISPCERLEQRGLARTVGAQDHGEAGPDLQRKITQHQKRAIAGAQTAIFRFARGPRPA
jgi:hypothetical protein